jgi:hypothetical protein
MNRPGFIHRLLHTLRGWLAPLPAPLPQATSGPPPAPVTRRIGLLVIDPLLPNGRRLSRHMGWNDSARLTAALIADLREVSHGYANYAIAGRYDMDTFPVKQDGFRYTAEDYLRRWETRAPFHHPDDVNYNAIIEQFDLTGRVNRGEIDEVWAICFPWGGFYESRMVGPGAFFCNAPPLQSLRPAARRYVIMCFNYERGVGEMLESYGHRAESILNEQFRRVPEPENLWRRFTLYDKIAAGRAEVGNIHFAPNSLKDYEWGSLRPVPSRCRNWSRFPDLSGDPVTVDCREWGGGDIRLHHKWWFSLLPRVGGETRGISNNWWEYIVDPNRVG